MARINLVRGLTSVTTTLVNPASPSPDASLLLIPSPTDHNYLLLFAGVYIPCQFNLLQTLTEFHRVPKGRQCEPTLLWMVVHPLLGWGVHQLVRNWIWLLVEVVKTSSLQSYEFGQRFRAYRIEKFRSSSIELSPLTLSLSHPSVFHPHSAAYTFRPQSDLDSSYLRFSSYQTKTTTLKCVLVRMVLS